MSVINVWQPQPRIVRVFVSSYGEGEKGRQVTNAVLVAGTELSLYLGFFPNKVHFSIKDRLNDILKSMRPAAATIAPPTDDFNDLDYAGADLRLSLRKILIAEMGAVVLGD